MSRRQSPEREKGGFVPSGFFAFRTPLLAFDEFLAWCEGLEAGATIGDSALLEPALAADRKRLRERLRALFERPLLRDALFLASPDLDDSFGVWIREPESERGARVERALVRYFSRMTARPTPFGLFAGASLGAVGPDTDLVISERSAYTRHSRLDMDYLFALAEAIGRDPLARPHLRLLPNSSLYRAAGRVHYVEARVEGKDRTHHLVAAEDSDELQAVLARAASGASADELVETVRGADVSEAEAAQYIVELIEAQILRADLELSVTGPEPVESLAAQLCGLPETEAVGARLEEVRAELAAIDAAGPGADPARYRAVARRLEGLPAPAELNRLFQVDLVKPSPDARLGGAVLDELVRGVELLRRLTSARSDGDLERFRDAFRERYEAREVPLVEALDDEAGIGFPPREPGSSDAGPLLKGLALGKVETPTTPWGAREKALLARLAETISGSGAEISLDSERLGDLGLAEPLALPPSFAVMATVAAASREDVAAGRFRIVLQGLDGPSGARLLGRFCHADPHLEERVRQHLRAEEALDPEAIYAEVVHLPEGRLGNILARPVLREHEIPYLGRSGAPADRQVPVHDLLVSVEEGQIVLRSRRLDCRVIPRLTTAHNYAWKGLPLYRFLCDLQSQGAARGLGWDWGPLASAPFLPRVVCGRLVLALAQWNAGGEELKALAAEQGARRFEAVRQWRLRRGVPRIVVVADGDNRLPVDLENVLSVESFVHLVKDRPEARLTEMFPGPDELCARGPEGRFVHDLIVPFTRAAGPRTAVTDAPAPRSAVQRLPPVVRVFPPGSEWLYAKLYAGAATGDRLLLDLVEPIVRSALDSGAADRWFFLRYADPVGHLRVRLHGDPSRLLGEVLPALHAATAPALADGRIAKVQLDTYEREVERYGGPAGIDVVEQIFQADSEAVLEILGMLEEGDAGADERWRLTLRGMDSLLDDFGLDFARKRDLVEQSRAGLAREQGGSQTEARRSLGERFRKESKSLERLLDRTSDAESSLAPGLAVLGARSARIAPRIRELGENETAGRLTRPAADIVGSIVHMHVNRMLRSAQRTQELVLYDFLARLYTSRALRGAGRA